MNKRLNQFSLEVRERSVRMVQEHCGEYPSLCAAIEFIASKIGCVTQTLNEWVKRDEVDNRQRKSLTTSEREQLTALQRKGLQIAPSCYRRDAVQMRNPALRCARAHRDGALIPDIQRFWYANMHVYGADKVWKQMNREGIAVAR